MSVTIGGNAPTTDQQTEFKDAFGLGNVDDTSDANKPVSTAQAAAINTVATAAAAAQTTANGAASAAAAAQTTANGKAPAGTGTGGAVTAADVGLGNVNNTADSAKPVSTAQAAAIGACLQASGNLTDLPSKPTARQNLGVAAVAPTPVTASRALTLADAGAVLTLTGATPYSLSLIPGLGRITLRQLGTASLTVTLGTATTLSGVTASSLAQQSVTLVEQSAGVYVGEAASIFGPVASLSNLVANFPANAHFGKQALVGTAAPYTTYKSNGTNWVAVLETVGSDASLILGAMSKAVMAVSGFIAPKVMRWIAAGDSFATNMNVNKAPTAAVCTAGVVLVTLAAHGIPPNGKISTTGFNTPLAQVHEVNATIVSSSQFSYPAPGCPDGDVLTGAANPSRIIDYSIQTEVGILPWLGRLSGGVQIIGNAGVPGNTMRNCLTYWATRVAAKNPDGVLWDAGYNDLYQIALGTAGYSVASMLADLDTVIANAQALGCVLVVASLCAISNGVTADAPAAHAAVVSYNAQARAKVEAAGYFWIDRYRRTAGVGVAPSKARTGVFQAVDAIHPNADLCRLSAGDLLLQPGFARRLVARAMSVSTYDSTLYGGNNGVRQQPVLNNSGGTLTGSASAALPSGETGFAGVSTGITCASSGGGSQTSSAFTLLAPDGSGVGAQGHRLTAVAAGDQMRTSISMVGGDFALGDIVYFGGMASLTTAHAASNKTPAGQNVLTWQLKLIATVSGVAYTLAESNPTEVCLTADLVSLFLCRDGVAIPTGGTLDSLRLDLNTQHNGGGTSQQTLWAAYCRRNTYAAA